MVRIIIGWFFEQIETSPKPKKQSVASQLGTQIQQQEAEFTFYLHDHLGNTRVALYENGAMKEYCDYYPFGMVLRKVIAGEDSTRNTFTGKELVLPSLRSGTMWP